MKKFLIQTGKFLLVVFLVLNAAGWILLKFNLQGHAVENGFIYDSIAKARKSWPETEIFLLGDSVATQMYPPKDYSGRINSFSMVVPTTLAGQFFLLQRLAEGNDFRGKKILLLLTPSGLKLDFSQDGTFHYVLKPFYNSEFAPWNCEFFSGRLENTWVALLSQLPMVRCSNWIPPINFLKRIPANGKSVSDLNREYLLKIKSLVDEKGGHLKIRCTIQPESNRGKYEENLRADLKAMHLDEVFDGYLESAVFLSDAIFNDDKVHLADAKKLPHNFLSL